MRVLIVEDETIVALDLRERLRGLGYEPCGIADSPDKAFALAAETRPQLVLMDIMLKGDGDGVSAAARIRAAMDVPIIFVTAFSDEETLERVKATSPYGYIVKPYHERELRIAIELAVAKHQSELELLRAKRAAEESDRAKTRFLANLSHEFITPINSMLGFVELAGSMSADAELAEYLGLIASSAHRLENLVRSLLDFAKLESGSLSVVKSEFYLEDFLLSCWAPFQVEAFAKGLGLRYYIDPDLPRAFRGDSAKIGLIVRALVDNAVKFTPSGSVLLSAEREGERLVLRVSDTGPGIPSEDAERVFGTFVQGDDSPTRRAGGLGLGLALSRGLAALLGAELRLEGYSGGVTMSLRLPDATDGRGPSVRDEVASALRGLRLGLADPPPRCAPELRRWGEALGFKVVPADEACELVVAELKALHDGPPGGRPCLALGSPVEPPAVRGAAGCPDAPICVRPYPLGLYALSGSIQSTLGMAAGAEARRRP